MTLLHFALAASVAWMPAVHAASIRAASQAPSQAAGQDAVAPSAAQPPSGERPTAMTQAAPFPLRFAVRAALLAEKQPTVNQLVLVPDAATYLDEIGHWTIDRRWPVLIEDDRFTPLFVQSFQPARVFRRASVGGLPAVNALASTIERMAAESWTPGATAMKDALAQRRVPPGGVVLYDPRDPAWTAALALAAGRGQLLVPMTGFWGDPDTQIDAAKTIALCDLVQQSVASTGMSYDTLGDDIDAVTVCRVVAGRGTPGDRTEFSSPYGPPKIGEPIAITDAMCRKAEGRESKRWAIAGWMFGDEVRSAYMAMCSLFLAQKTAWLNDCPAYPSNAAARVYDAQPAVDQLAKRGMTAQLKRFVPGALEPWRKLASSGWTPDIEFINSMGNVNTFTLVKDHDATVRDIPMVSRPMGLYMIHSFSLAAPASPNCVGNRWLEHGVFAYAGSVHEPMLNAFVPAQGVAERVAGGVPLLVASRWLEGPWDRCWRVQTIGDPLWIPTPEGLRGALVDAAPRAGLEDLLTVAAEAIRELGARPTDQSAAAALRAVSSMGRLELAQGVWANAREHGVAKGAASTAIMPLFLNRSVEGVAQAIAMIDRPTLVQLDALWTLAAAPLQNGAIANPDTLRTLLAHPRVPMAWVDLTLVRANAIRVLGADEFTKLQQATLLTLDEGERAEFVKRAR